MSYEPTVWVDGDHVTSAKLNKLEQGVNSMSYTPTVWNAGDVVTAEKLNKLEQGVAEGGGGGATFPTFAYDGRVWSCDMTYAEVSTVYEELELDGGCPCITSKRQQALWDFIFFTTDSEVISGYESVPTEVTAGFVFDQEKELFGNDGQIYVIKSM